MSTSTIFIVKTLVLSHECHMELSTKVQTLGALIQFLQVKTLQPHHGMACLCTVAMTIMHA